MYPVQLFYGYLFAGATFPSLYIRPLRVYEPKVHICRWAATGYCSLIQSNNVCVFIRVVISIVIMGSINLSIFAVCFLYVSFLLFLWVLFIYSFIYFC